MFVTIMLVLLLGPLIAYKKTTDITLAQADHIAVYKHKKILMVSKDNKIIKKYPVSLGYKEGKKTQSGDGKTPEGRYTINGKKHKSIFLHSLHISYPNRLDVQYAQQSGIHPGDSITIHGTGDDSTLKKSMQRGDNWTRGCIGMHNHHIKELFQHITVGTIIDIHP